MKTIAKVDTEKVFLLEEELKLLASTPCPKEEWKQAFLFSCFTGLRLSDMLALTWEKIQGDKIHFRQKKTDGFEYLPLHKSAKDIHNLVASHLDDEPKPTDKIFCS